MTGLGLLRRELIHGGVVVLLTGVEDACGEILLALMVDAVGHHLGLQAEAGLGLLRIAAAQGEEGILEEVS